jgi:hypothetical protein
MMLNRLPSVVAKRKIIKLIEQDKEEFPSLLDEVE